MRAADPPPALYGARAAFYDRIYHWKDYAGEVRALVALLGREGVAAGARLLDAACGTGSHLVHLRRHYDVAGFDASPELLALAGEKLPGVPFAVADLTDFTVERPFDVVTCLFSAIGYVFPEARLRASARSFAAALAPGGVALVEPWLLPDRFREGTVGYHAAVDGLPKLVRMSRTVREGRKTVIDFRWLVGDPGGLDGFGERHAMWMYTQGELVGAFADAGLETRFDEPGPMGRGLVVARKPAGP